MVHTQCFYNVLILKTKGFLLLFFKYWHVFDFDVSFSEAISVLLYDTSRLYSSLKWFLKYDVVVRFDVNELCQGSELRDVSYV